MRDPFTIFWGVIALVALSLLGWGYWRAQRESAPTVVGAPPEAPAASQEEGGDTVAIPEWLRKGSDASRGNNDASQPPQQQASAEPLPDRLYATISTNRGTIVIELFAKETPQTVANFVKLAQQGFYDGVRFHRVIPGFMIQTGDPLSKDPSLKDRWGTGGPGYTIPDEFVPGLSNVRGTVAMANTGAPNSGGSQFFINVADNTYLDFDKDPKTSRHPVFGRVIAGMDVVDAIANTPRDELDRPREDIVIRAITIHRTPPQPQGAPSQS